MKSLATLGDGFLKLAVSLSLYHRYPFYDRGKLTEARSEQVSNDNLYRKSIEKGLKPYLNTTKIIFCGDNANWIPPGYTIDEGNSERYLKQKVKPKLLADIIEALIGAVLISTGYSAAIKFMNWLGLDVIPIDQHGKHQIWF
jgi:endoribonuclease Dicer